MTVPLFDVKAKLCEYVTLAENGDVIEITKHGNAHRKCGSCRGRSFSAAPGPPPPDS